MNFRLLPAAIDDLRHLDNWIAASFGDSTAARVQQELFADFERLALSPYIGISRPDVLDPPFRFLYSNLNWIVYRPGSPLEIHQVFSARMDIRTLQEEL